MTEGDRNEIIQLLKDYKQNVLNLRKNLQFELKMNSPEYKIRFESYSEQMKKIQSKINIL